MRELRCKKCDKLLLKHDCNANIETKCPRCKTVNGWIPTDKMKLKTPTYPGCLY